MKQSMSRVAHCIDNGPMEGFWGYWMYSSINSVHT
jgi:transposase InsO family protein